jgi:hypothetical protein
VYKSESLIVQFQSLLLSLVKIFPFSTLSSNSLSLCYSLTVRDQVLHSYRHNYNLYVFRQQTRRQKDQDWMVASIIRIQSPFRFLWVKFLFVTVVYCSKLNRNMSQ